MIGTPIVNAREHLVRGPNPWSPHDQPAVHSDDARNLELGQAKWRALADRLAQRVRSFPRNDARDREVLRDYETTTSESA